MWQARCGDGPGDDCLAALARCLELLPDRLLTLHLAGHQLTSQGFAGLTRFVQLRPLHLDTRPQARFVADLFAPADAAARADALAAALASLDLQELRCGGDVSPELLAAIAARPHLTTLVLISDRLPELTPLATAPALQHLQLSLRAIEPGTTNEQLAPLSRCQALREVVIHATVAKGLARPGEAELQRALGGRIRLSLHQEEVVVRR